MYQITKSHAKLERVAATEATRYAIQSIRLEPGPDAGTGLAVATDGKRVAVRECGRGAADTEPINLLAKPFAKLLRSAPSAFVSRGDNGAAHIESPNGECDMEHEDRAFPDWRGVVPAPEYAAAFAVDADLLQKLLETVPVSRDSGRRLCVLGVSANPALPMTIASTSGTEFPLFALIMPVTQGGRAEMHAHLAACRARVVKHD